VETLSPPHHPLPLGFGDTVSVTVGFIGFSWNVVLEFFTKCCLASVRCDKDGPVTTIPPSKA